MSSRPLKSIGNGALQEMTLSDEEYLAYLAGLQLSEFSDVGALTTDNSKTAIGTYFDTYYSGTSGQVTSTEYDLGTINNTVTVTTSVSGSTVYQASSPTTPAQIVVGDVIKFTTVHTYSAALGSDFSGLRHRVIAYVDGIGSGTLETSNIQYTGPTGANYLETPGQVYWITANDGSGTLSVDWIYTATESGSLVFSLSTDLEAANSVLDEDVLAINTIIISDDPAGSISVSLDTNLEETVNLGNVEVGSIIYMTVTGDPILLFDESLSTGTANFTWNRTSLGSPGTPLLGYITVDATGSSDVKFTTTLPEGAGTLTANVTFTGVTAGPSSGFDLNSDATTLYQNLTDTVAQRSNSNWRGLLEWNTDPAGNGSKPPALKEMPDPALDVFVQRLVKTIMHDELPGVFRLSAISPGADWTSLLVMFLLIPLTLVS